VNINRLSECPESLRTIPWQSVQIKFANIRLTDDERYEILKDFETERSEMKILQKNQQDIYVVDLITNGKSIDEYVSELRKKQPPPPPPPQILPAVQSDVKSENTTNDNLTILITEQRRQNRLLEQLLAAINTSNALLTQLVQR